MGIGAKKLVKRRNKSALVPITSRWCAAELCPDMSSPAAAGRTKARRIEIGSVQGNEVVDRAAV